MPAERYFVDLSFSENQALAIEGAEFHHLRYVMRTKEKETIELVNGKDQLATGIVEKIERHQAIIKILQANSFPGEKKEAILALGLPRMSNLEWILEKGTELGITAFWLFPTELSEKKTLTPNQLQRLQYILVSALKQCGRLDLPKLLFKKALVDWEKPLLPFAFGDTRASASFLQTTPSLFAIGPEKGFSPKEVEILEQKLGAKGVKLHDNILRTETAALAAAFYIHKQNNF